jgi:hypothetical protein
MASYTKTEQIREAVLVDGVEKYKVTVTVTDAGDLSTEYIFTINIVETSDPKDDTFARVSAILDFDDYLEDRAQAVAAGDDYYRVNYWVFYYDNLKTAVNAATTLKSRVDELVEDWRIYDKKFETVTEETEHPQVETDTFNAAVDDYDDAVEAEAEAKEERDDTKDTYDEAVADAATATTAVSDAQSKADDCATTKGYFDDLLAGVVTFYAQANAFGLSTGQAGIFPARAKTFKTAANALRNASCVTSNCGAGVTDPYDTAESTFTAQITTMETDLEAYRQNVKTFESLKNAATANQTLFAAKCASAQTALATAQTAKTTADEEVATARTDYEDTQTAYEVAQAKTEAALAAVRALKPSWTPSTTASATGTTSST